MDSDLKGKVALISGGGTGIGEACARLLATNGCSVAVVGRRLDPINKVAEEVGGLAVQGDASSHHDCRSVVEKITSRFGRLDILISCAGIMREGNITTMSSEDWQDSMDANLNSIMELSRASLPAMIEGGGGTIVNIASLGGLVAPGNMAAYITSKTAVIGLTRSLAVDYGPQGVRVNTLCPGWVLTPMSEAEMAHYAKESNITTAEAIKHATRYLPLQRMAKPEEIARCVRFLASDDSSFITGTTLVADGGSSAVDVGYISL